MSLPLTLPVIQNWSCHNCGGCCRQHQIEITAEERQRILNQKWEGSDWLAAGQPLLRETGAGRRRRYFLAHQPDGACAFLDEKGLCRIHAKFGEAAKPLACRIYPYAFHPAGKRITVSLRFSCPSVVANRGRPVALARDELNQMARLVVPEHADRLPPPRITDRQKLNWPDVMQVLGVLDRLIAPARRPFALRVHQMLQLVELLGSARLDQIQDDRLEEFLELIEQTVLEEPLPAVAAPSPAAAVQFRLLAAQYARCDTAADVARGWKGRWELLSAALRFARGRGLIPKLQADFKDVPFDALESPFGAIPPEVDEILTRYLRVKLQGLHFCGAACFGLPLIEGWQAQLLILPVVCWIARWLAAGEGRSVWTTEDFSRALAVADHHHGFTPIFGTAAFRRRTRSLARSGEIIRLLQWYSRPE